MLHAFSQAVPHMQAWSEDVCICCSLQVRDLLCLRHALAV